MKLWIPGPTHVREAILAECAGAMIGHRGEDMARLIERIDAHLPLAFGLEPGSSARAGVHTCSATGVMEGALLGAGKRVLCAVNGAFSRRWHEIAKLLGKETLALEVPPGEAVAPERLARTLRDEGPFDALTLVASETSTGVATPLGPIAEILAGHPETLFLVDVVTWLAAAPVDFDRHRIDLAFAGSQKALALPPGITVLCASQRWLERARAAPRPSFYLDLVRVLDGHAGRRTPATPCIPLYRALARQLEDISAGATAGDPRSGPSGADAWRARFEKHARMRTRTEQWAEQHGLEPLPAAGLRSPSVSCIRSGPLDVPKLLAALRRRGFQIGNGYGDLKDKTFRIGHMGDHDERGLAELLAAADEAIGELHGA
ncbi:MAG TPA: aminotransferase class V-fold PLP-dependent enzyme [Planctomycetota bacterium]|nr:aminotransferase class V-fold PLP-dependent enzyme [Planctomycetota bacterium]